jgi:hypothetical protein
MTSAYGTSTAGKLVLATTESRAVGFGDDGLNDLMLLSENNGEKPVEWLPKKVPGVDLSLEVKMILADPVKKGLARS